MSENTRQLAMVCVTIILAVFLAADCAKTTQKHRASIAAETR